MDYKSKNQLKQQSSQSSARAQDPLNNSMIELDESEIPEIEIDEAFLHMDLEISELHEHPAEPTTTTTPFTPLAAPTPIVRTPCVHIDWHDTTTDENNTDENNTDENNTDENKNFVEDIEDIEDLWEALKHQQKYIPVGMLWVNGALQNTWGLPSDTLKHHQAEITATAAEEARMRRGLARCGPRARVAVWTAGSDGCWVVLLGHGWRGMVGVSNARLGWALALVKALL